MLPNTPNINTDSATLSAKDFISYAISINAIQFPADGLILKSEDNHHISLTLACSILAII